MNRNRPRNTIRERKEKTNSLNTRPQKKKNERKTRLYIHTYIDMYIHICQLFPDPTQQKGPFSFSFFLFSVFLDDTFYLS